MNHHTAVCVGLRKAAVVRFLFEAQSQRYCQTDTPPYTLPSDENNMALEDLSLMCEWNINLLVIKSCEPNSFLPIPTKL